MRVRALHLAPLRAATPASSRVTAQAPAPGSDRGTRRASYFSMIRDEKAFRRSMNAAFLSAAAAIPTISMLGQFVARFSSAAAGPSKRVVKAEAVR